MKYGQFGLTIALPAALLLPALLVLPRGVSAREEPAPRTVSVEGMGEVKAAPDEVFFWLLVWREAKEPASARREMARAASRILEAFRQHDIPEKDFQTRAASISAQYATGPGRKRELKGYRASTSITVKLRKLDAYDEVITSALEAGANGLGGIGFSHSRLEELQDEARRKAMEDAARKARLLASAAGSGIGKVREIREIGRPMPRKMLRAPMAAGAEMEAAPDTLAEGEVEIEARVAVTWELKD